MNFQVSASKDWDFYGIKVHHVLTLYGANSNFYFITKIETSNKTEVYGKIVMFGKNPWA